MEVFLWFDFSNPPAQTSPPTSLKLRWAKSRGTEGRFFGGKIDKAILIWNALSMDPAISPTQAPIPDEAQQPSQPLHQLTNKSELPIVLLIMGILGIIILSIPGIYIITKVLPQASQINTVIKTSLNPGVSYLIFTLIVIIPLLEVFYGVILIKKQKKEIIDATQKNKAKILLVIGIIAAVIYLPSLFILIITPIYDAVGSIK